jgi:hypothetical protein
MRPIDWPLSLSRALYAAVALGAGAWGVLQLRAAEPSPGLATLFLGTAALAGAAAAWVRSSNPVLGALARIGVVVGALPAVMPALAAATMLPSIGVWPRVALAACSLAVAIAAIRTMWRRSRRPWRGARSTDQRSTVR